MLQFGQGPLHKVLQEHALHTPFLTTAAAQVGTAVLQRH